MIVRDFRSDDGEAVERLLVAAFGGPGEAALVEQLRADGDAAIELVAEANGEIVGHILYSPMHAPFRALGLAPLSVTPVRQRQGIGSTLMQAGDERAASGGWEGVFVLGDSDYYSRFGYDRALAEQYECAYSGPHFMLKALQPKATTARGAVSYAPAFAALEE